MEMTALEISCPGCGAAHRVDMCESDPLFPIESFVENAKTYKFDGEAACGCGRLLVASLQVSAFPLRREAERAEGGGMTRNEVLEMVRMCGCALAYAPEELKTSEVCLAAVRQDGDALEYAPEALKTPEVCLTAVYRSGSALQFAPEKLRTETLCMIAVAQDASALQFVPEELRERVKAAAEAKRKQWEALGWAPKGGINANADRRDGAYFDNAGEAMEFVMICADESERNKLVDLMKTSMNESIQIMKTGGKLKALGRAPELRG